GGEFTHGRDRSLGDRLLARQLRLALLSQEELADRRSEARRQASRLRRQHGQLLPRSCDARARGVDEDDAESALRGLLRVRGPEAALLERAGHERRSFARDGRAWVAAHAGGDDDAVVEVLNYGVIRPFASSASGSP